ncbi:unnamed protein product [Symbiodinium pilosum]|uniref:Uncharacterized protein n=1 Tax=Symbiodinium pilosum TaxID=2952 RepID=A0A812JUJ3_SYMPI|nr:unnamed protein product [Symbiodinium pilosum]
MEQERSNLMCVINQARPREAFTEVNQNFEHLSRELSQLTDVVGRIQQEVVDVRQQKDVEISQRVQQLEELQAGHRLEVRQSQQCVNVQILEMQRQLAPLVESERANATFETEVRAYLDDLRQLVHDSEVQWQSVADRVSRLQSEVPACVADEVRRHIQVVSRIKEDGHAELSGHPRDLQRQERDVPKPSPGQLHQLKASAVRERRGSLGSLSSLHAQAPSDESAQRWLEGEHRKARLAERLPEGLPGYAAQDRVDASAPELPVEPPKMSLAGLRQAVKDDLRVLHNGDQRLLELLLGEEHVLQSGDLSGSSRWLSQGPEAESVPPAGFHVT